VDAFILCVNDIAMVERPSRFVHTIRVKRASQVVHKYSVDINFTAK
jgi:hypothetical protein